MGYAGNPTRFDRWNPSTGQVQTISHLYNGANQVECIDADANGVCNGTEFWVYDAHGNLLNDGSMQYTYDAAMRLKTVTTNGVTTTYKYNGDGARMEQSVSNGILPATVTTYTLDTALPLTQVLSETTSGQTTRYLHGLDLIAQSDGTSAEYFAYDGLGSVRQIVDGTGTVLTSQTFDPYGTPYSEMSAEQSAFGFTGEQTDENGLVYLRARYYNPSQGRFMQIDPSRLERNGYQYAGSSPTMFTDPSGHCMDRNDPNYDGIPTWPAFLGGKPCIGSGLTTCNCGGIYDPVCNSISARDRGNVLSFNLWEASPLVQTMTRTGQMWQAIGEGRWGDAGRLYGENLLDTFSMTPVIGMAINTARSGPSFAEQNYQLVADYDTALSHYRTGSGGSWDVVWSTSKVAGVLSGTYLLGRATQGALNNYQVNAGYARQWTYLNEYYPSSAIGTASPGTLSRLVNGFASQRAANTMMAMPEYQVPLGGAPVYNLLGAGGNPVGPYTRPGTTWNEGGHHIHQQAAFRGDPNYDPRQALVLRHPAMDQAGYSHRNMSIAQRSLYDDLFARYPGVPGNQITMLEHNRIAVAVLEAGGVPTQLARNWVAQSLWNLRGMGVRMSSRIPWH